ncbi:trypsin-like cysteine/serine peptidase domain-containing protein [Ochromonadaceae sp. CCMP2298]|nr:trypsin-like cysteine/serine peptidase domain-containing protein [Ochromonadaceae sp. CCMP2298]|mmetsp:Transcript_17337/g.38472  ORF Transcript_17337/g.38472 Transcript_17337/m.38472 type:complete len:305 (-) Transcript_17337:21-935(-)
MRTERGDRFEMSKSGVIDLTTSPPGKKASKRKRAASKANRLTLTEDLEDELKLALEKSKLVPTEQYVVRKTVRIRGGKKAKKQVATTAGLRATVIFAQYECGTAVCIGAGGRFLTCAHCLGEEPQTGIQKFVVFMSGRIVLTESIAVDEKADLALLKVVGEYRTGNEMMDYEVAGFAPFPSVPIGESLTLGETLVCYGQPGCDDLESKTAQKTGYDVFVRSIGLYENCLEGGIDDNTEIGKLQHGCWTYWGHSGAPLLNVECQVVGLHSSWDDEEETRHGVHLSAIQNFLAKRVQFIVTECIQK